MSIVEKQIQKLTQRASVEHLKSGKVISLTELGRIIAAKAKTLSGGPTHTVRYQEYKRPFNLLAYNEMQEEIVFDIEVLYELLKERTEFILKSYTEADLSYKAQKAQLNLVKETIDELLLTAKNTEDNFHAIVDTFNTLNKVDISQSTQDLFDLIEGSVSLPYNAPSTKRHSLTHLANKVSADTIVKTAKNQAFTGRNGAGTIFGNIFTDISSLWRYEVITEDQTGCELIVTFPVTDDNTAARLTRFEIGVLPISKTTIRLLVSNDNVNFIRPPQTIDKVVFEETQRMAWDFEEIAVKYIRLSITKEVPDSAYSFDANIINPALAGQSLITNQASNQFGINNLQKWLYAFTITNLSIYKVGRSMEGLLISKPLSTSVDKPINYLSIESEEEVLPNTAIDYQLALSDSVGNLITNWTPINPINRPQSNIPNYIQFGKTVEDRFEFNRTNTFNTGQIVTNNAIDFYQLYTGLTGDYTLGYSKLYRGYNLWSKETNKNETVKSVVDNYLDFSDQTKTKHLYGINTESALIYNRLVSNASVMRTYLGLTKQIISSPKIKPDPFVDPFTDTNPDYAILKLEHVRPTMQITQLISPTGIPVSVQGVQIPVANAWTGTAGGMSSIGVPILLNGQPIDIVPSSIVLRYSSVNFSYTFKLGVDYVIKRSDDPYFNAISGWNSFPLHWRIIPTEPVSVIVSSGSALTGVYGNTGTFIYTGSALPPVTLGSVSLSSTQELVVEFTINPDITHRITNVHYESNELELDTQLELGPGDSVLVTYRFIPSRVIRETVKVTSQPSENNPGNTYQEGFDYTFNPINSTITQLIGGALYGSSSQSCYVDFKYKDFVTNTITFSTWCFYDSAEPYRFDYNAISIKKELGESISWIYTDGNNTSQKELTDIGTIILSRGWHLFVVRSLDPAVYNDAAIIKAIKLKSIDNKYLFISKPKGGELFSSITANREPLQEVTFSYLKNSTLRADHTKFAVDSGKIYTNFKPVDNEDIWPYYLNTSGTLLALTQESFTFTGKRYIDLSEQKNYILLKARLSRSHNSDGGITPKIFSYTIRVGY